LKNGRQLRGANKDFLSAFILRHLSASLLWR
jgi:hypothetical protein